MAVRSTESFIPYCSVGCLVCCIVIFLGICSIVRIENAKHYEDGTLTLCGVTHRNYDGECLYNNRNGKMYTYTAVSPLCPDVELHSKIEACQRKPWNQNWYDYDEIMKVGVNETAECYVPDCSEKSFAWDWDIEWKKGNEWIAIYIYIGFLSAAVCFIIVAFCNTQCRCG